MGEPAPALRTIFCFSLEKPGALVLDFYDAHNKQLIWRGVSQDTLSDKPEKNGKKLEKSVDKLTKCWSTFPRRAKVSPRGGCRANIFALHPPVVSRAALSLEPF